MRISLKTKPMYQASEDMTLMQKKLNAYGSELAQIRRDLMELSGLDEPLAQLRQCEKRLEIHAGYCGLFGNAINQICRLYEHAEVKIIDYSEDAIRKARRESLGSRNLKGLYPLFRKVISIAGGN